MADQKIVLYIDESEDDRFTYAPKLQECFGDEVLLIDEPPPAKIADCVQRILDQPNLAALVFDQRLTGTGVADFYGLQLAEAIRQVNSKVPIYILSGYSGDLNPNDPTVEYILDKELLTEDAYVLSVSARVRRRMNVYLDILSEREQRFEELLLKSTKEVLTDKEVLTEDEIKEFEALQFWRNKSVLAEETIGANKLKQSLDVQEKIIDELAEQLGLEKEG